MTTKKVRLFESLKIDKIGGGTTKEKLLTWCLYVGSNFFLFVAGVPAKK